MVLEEAMEEVEDSVEVMEEEDSEDAGLVGAMEAEGDTEVEALEVEVSEGEDMAVSLSKPFF